MKEENLNAEQVLAQILNKALEVGDFMTEQAPLVVQELLAYESVAHCVFAILCACFLFAFLLAIKWCFKEIKSDKHYNESGYVMLMLLSIAASVLLFFSVVNNALDVFKIIVAPRIYLLEYAAELVK